MTIEGNTVGGSTTYQCSCGRTIVKITPKKTDLEKRMFALLKDINVTVEESDGVYNYGFSDRDHPKYWESFTWNEDLKDLVEDKEISDQLILMGSEGFD